MNTLSNSCNVLSAEQSRRLASECARLNRHTFEIADGFVSAFRQECPGVPFLNVVASNAARYEFAWNVAEVVKNLGDLRRVSPMLEYAGRTANRSGWTNREWSAARRCLLSAIGTKCDNWNAQTESDFAAAIDACFACMRANSSLGAHSSRGASQHTQRKAA